MTALWKPKRSIEEHGSSCGRRERPKADFFAGAEASAARRDVLMASDGSQMACRNAPALLLAASHGPFDIALRAAVAANPFPQSDVAAKTVHLCFLNEPGTDPDLAAMDRLKATDEEFVLTYQDGALGGGR